MTAWQTLLASNLPFGCGIPVYESFESAAVAKTGMVPMPNTKTEQLMGGHAIVICGIDTARQLAICRNSWNTDWGMAGYFMLPLAYLVKLASDFWVVQQTK